LNQQDTKVDANAEVRAQKLVSKRLVGLILSIVMIALTVYVLNLQHQNFNVLSKSMDMALSASDRESTNYRTYVGKYKETKIELDETTRKLQVVQTQLNQVTDELTATKSMLAQTQGWLADAQAENTKLTQQLKGLDQLRAAEGVASISQLQTKIKSLKDKDSLVSLQLEDLKDQLRAYQAEFSDTDQGRSLIKLFQNKIRAVKNRIRYLNQEAYRAKIAAQKEKDRLAVMNGNSGFMVHDGLVQNPDGTKRTFAIDVKLVQ